MASNIVMDKLHIHQSFSFPILTDLDQVSYESPRDFVKVQILIP